VATKGTGRPAKAKLSKKGGVAVEVVGWRERVDLPDLGIRQVKAKVDTGARSSCLHADDIEIFWKRDAQWVRFVYRAKPESRGRKVEVPLLNMRWVKSSNGQREHRPAISTVVHLGHHTWHCEVTLSPRWAMGFPMLLGREALRRRFLINPGRSFLLSSKEAHVSP